MASSNRKRVSRGSRDVDYRGNQYEDLGIKKSNSVVTGAKPSAPKPMPGKRPTAPKPMPGVRPSAPKPMPSDRMRAGFRVPAEAGPGSHPRLAGADARAKTTGQKNPGSHPRSSGIIARSKDTFNRLSEKVKPGPGSRPRTSGQEARGAVNRQRRASLDMPPGNKGALDRMSGMLAVMADRDRKKPGSHDRLSGAMSRLHDQVSRGKTTVNIDAELPYQRRAAAKVAPGGHNRRSGIEARLSDSAGKTPPGGRARTSGQEARGAVNQERRANMPMAPGGHSRMSGVIARSMDTHSQFMAKPLNKGPIARNGPMIPFEKSFPKAKQKFESAKKSVKGFVIPKTTSIAEARDTATYKRISDTSKKSLEVANRGWKSVDKTVMGAAIGAGAGAAVGGGFSAAGRAIGFHIPGTMTNTVLPSAIGSAGLTTAMNPRLSGSDRIRHGLKTGAIVGGAMTALTVASKVNPVFGAAAGAVVGGVAGAALGYRKDREEDRIAAEKKAIKKLVRT